ncbi:MAG: hypothetical protein QXD89_01645 [Candidatus Aenigmatarchaeota archaeon]
MKFDPKMLKDLLISPQASLLKLEKEKIENAVIQMLLNWILLSVSFSLLLDNSQYVLPIIFAGILINLLFAFLLTLGLTIVGGKGKLKNSLDATTYPFFGFSLSFLVVSLISKANSTASIILGVFLFSIYLLIALVGSLRVLKEAFKLDIVTIWIVKSLIITSLILTVYFTLFLTPFFTNQIASIQTSSIPPLPF